MRIIKFRGFNKKNQKWIYGYYFVSRGLHFIVQDRFVNPFAEAEDFMVDEETIGQFTGLKDENGVDIYEGDVVKAVLSYNEYRREWIGVIEWDEISPSMCIKNIANSYDCEYDFSKCDCLKLYVIGSIHDNPELIKSL